MTSTSFQTSGSGSTGTHYPVRKDILAKIHPSEVCKLGAFIRHLLWEASTFPLVWDPKTQHRKNGIEPSWELIKRVLANGNWKGFSKCLTLIENAEEIFLDQRHQFYCDYIENHGFVEGTDMDEYDYLESNAPATSEELFRLVLEERFLYPQFSSLSKPKAEESKEDKINDSDWSDIEEEKDYWAKLARQNEAKVAERASEVVEIRNKLNHNAPQPTKEAEKAAKAPNWLSKNAPDWRTLVTTEWQRKNATERLLVAITSFYELIDPVDLGLKAINSAKAVENETFKTVDTMEQYSRLLEERIREIQNAALIEKAKNNNGEAEETTNLVESTTEANDSVKNTNQDESDWSDIEADDYCSKMANENVAKEAEQVESKLSEPLTPTKLMHDYYLKPRQEFGPGYCIKKFSDIDECNFEAPEAAKHSQDWHVYIDGASRNKLVARVARAFFPENSDPEMDLHGGIRDIIRYAKSVEAELYEDAYNLNAYSFSVVRNASTIRKNTEEFLKKQAEVDNKNKTVDETKVHDVAFINWEEISTNDEDHLSDAKEPNGYSCDVTEDAADWSDVQVEDYCTKMTKEPDAKDAEQLKEKPIEIQSGAKVSSTMEKSISSEEAKWYYENDNEQIWENLARQNADRKAEKAKKELEQPKRRPASVASQEINATDVTEDESGWTAIKAEKFWAKWDRDNEARKVEEATKELKQSKIKAVSDRSHYQKTSSVRYQKEEPKNQEKSQHDADWSDVEAEGYWTKMAKENKPKETKEAEKNVEESGEAREEPNYEDLEEDFLVDTIVPAFEAAGKKLMSFGRIIAGTIKKILEEDEPVRKENNKSEQAAPRQIEMDVLNSSGKKIEKATEAKEAKETRTSVVRGFSNVTPFPVSTRLPYPPNCFPNTHVEEKIGLFGRVYYVNHWSNTISLDNPLGWRPLSYEWETKLTHNKEVYYYNHYTNISQWQRPITGPITLADFIQKAEEAKAREYDNESIARGVYTPTNESDQKEASEEHAPNPIKLAVEQRTAKNGHIYYENHEDKTTSMENPMEWKAISEEWEQKLSSERKVYYYNKITKATQWNRTTEE